MKLSQALDKILEVSFLTGSQVDGTSTKESDFDIVVPEDKLDEFTSMIQQSNKKQYNLIHNNYNKGIKIQTDFGIFNLIPVNMVEFKSWYFTTLTMYNVWKYTGCTTKELKINIFESINSAFTVQGEGLLPKLANNDVHRFIANQARYELLYDPTMKMLIHVKDS